MISQRWMRVKRGSRLVITAFNRADGLGVRVTLQTPKGRVLTARQLPYDVVLDQRGTYKCDIEIVLSKADVVTVNAKVVKPSGMRHSKPFRKTVRGGAGRREQFSLLAIVEDGRRYAARLYGPRLGSGDAELPEPPAAPEIDDVIDW